uniref:Uncharacterized protein n=1 Tax=Timema poppense TaxID=170557 RepID=A0A7R9D1J5_TIMPO|nr:unnamed protein product [Timema poppensis]
MDMSLGANTTMEEETEMDTEIDFPFDINDFEVIDEVGEVDYFQNDSSDSIDLCDDKEYSENVLQLDKALACEHIHSGETLAKNKDKSLCYNTLVHMKSEKGHMLEEKTLADSSAGKKVSPTTGKITKKESKVEKRNEINTKNKGLNKRKREMEENKPLPKKQKQDEDENAVGLQWKKTPTEKRGYFMTCIDKLTTAVRDNYREYLDNYREYRRWFEKNRRLCPIVDTHLPEQKILCQKCILRAGVEKNTGLLILGVRRKMFFVSKPDMLYFAPPVRKVIKACQELVKTVGKPIFDEVKRKGFWKSLLIRCNEAGDVLVQVDLHAANQKDADTIFKEMNYVLIEFFSTGSGKDCNVKSLYLKIILKHPGDILPYNILKHPGDILPYNILQHPGDLLPYKVFKHPGDLLPYKVLKHPGDILPYKVLKHPGDILPYKVLKHPGDILPYKVLKHPGDILPYKVLKHPGDILPYKVLKHPGDILPYKVLKHPGDILPYKVLKHPGDILPYKVLKHPGDILPYKVLKHPGDILPYKVLKHPGDILPYKVLKHPGDILPYKVLKHPGDILPYKVLKHPGDILPYKVLKHPGDILPYKVLKHPGDILPYKVLKHPGDILPYKVLKHPGDILPYKVLKHPGDILPYKVLKHPGDILPYKVLKHPGDILPYKVLKHPGDILPYKVLKHPGDILPYKVLKHPGDILPYKVLKHPGDILPYKVLKHPGDILPYKVLKHPGDILPYKVLKHPGDILPYKVLKHPGDILPYKVLKHPGDILPYKVLKHPGDLLPYKVLKHPGDILPYKIDSLSLVHLGEGVGISSNMASSEPRTPVQSSADFAVKCISDLLFDDTKSTGLASGNAEKMVKSLSLSFPMVLKWSQWKVGLRKMRSRPDRISWRADILSIPISGNLQCIFGSHSIEETVGGMKVKIYPHTYFNTSTGAMNMMLEVLTAVAKREGTTEVLEIGCGTGIIGQILSKCSNKVYGIDIEFAVEDARENAELNGVKNSRYFGGNTIVGLYHLATSLSKASNTLGIINSTSAEVISSMKVLKHVCQEKGIKKLVYVSVFSKRCYNNLLELFMPNNIKPTCSFLPYYIIPIDFGLHCYSAIVVMKRVENNFLDDLYNLPKIISLKDTPSSQFSDQTRECLVQILPHQHSQTADTTFFESNMITYDRDDNSVYEEKKISSNDRFVRDGFKDKVMYSGLSNKEFPHRDNISPSNVDLRKVLEDNMKDHYNSPTIDQNIKSNLADYPYSYSAKTKESTAVTEKIKQDINSVLGSKIKYQISRVSNKDKDKLVHVLKTNAIENVDVKVTDTKIKQSSTQEIVAQLPISEAGDVRTSNIQPTISSFSQSESPLKIKDKSMYSFLEDAHINKIHIYGSNVGENKSVRDECTLDNKIYQRYSGNHVASTELNNSATKSVRADIDTHDRNLDYNNEGIRIGSRDTTFQNKETSSQYIRINLAEVVISDTGGNVRNKEDYFTNFHKNYSSQDRACPKTVNSLNFKTTPTDIDLCISRPNIPGVDIYEDTVNDVCSVRRYDRPDLNDFDTKDARINRDFIAASNLLNQNGSQENKSRRDLGLSNWESQNRLNMLNYDHGANKVGRSFNAENEKEYMKSIDVGYNNQSIASRNEVTSRSFSTVPNLTTMGNKSSSKDFKPLNSSARLWGTHPHHQINKLNANKFDIKDSTPHSNTETQHYDLPTQIPTVQGNRINKHEEERSKKASFEVPLMKTRRVNFNSLRNVLDDKTKLPLRSRVSEEVWSFGRQLWGVSSNLGMGTQARLPDSVMGLFTNTAELTRNDRYFSDLDGKIDAANQCYEDFQSRMNYRALSSEESKYRSSTTNVNPLNKSDSHEDVKLEWPEEKARGVESVADVFWNTQRPSLNRTDHRAKTLYNPSGFASNKYWQDKTLSNQGAVSEASMPLSRRPGEVNTSTDHAVVGTFSSQHLLPPKEPPPFSKKSIHSLSPVRPSFVRTTNVQLDALGKPDQFHRSLHQYNDVHLSPQTMKPNQEEPYRGDLSVPYSSGLLSRDVPARTLPQQPGFGTLFGQPSSLYPRNNSAGVGLVSRSGSDTASWVPWTASTGPMYR